jgi:hypothetical protein
LSAAWTCHTDFLLTEWRSGFDFVVGNPPYVRIEDLPAPALSRYRALYETTRDRADIYIAFIQRGLELLAPEGTLAYICANRFAKNTYGAAIRRYIAAKFRVRHYINLEHTQPFVADVSAYPAIVVVDRQVGAPTFAASLDDISDETLLRVRAELADRTTQATIVSRFARWYPDGEPWISTSFDEHRILHRLRQKAKLLEGSAPGTRVGIGVATGSDATFVLPKQNETIEANRQIPLIVSGDVANERLTWSGKYLVNPFRDEDDGQLVDLGKYPGLAAHLQLHMARLQRRHVARSRPDAWYRTIDRIWPALQAKPKLLIPDIQAGCVIGHDEGCFYPHHNLYWITSSTWPLLALKALLRSDLVRQQVKAYSVQMRGGSLRYQAQTLRRIRVPALASLRDSLLERLATVACDSDSDEINDLAREAFGLRRRNAVAT